MIVLDKIHISKKTVRLWLALIVVAVASLADVMNSAAYHEDAALNLTGVCCVAVLKATVLTAIYAISRRYVWLKVIAISLIVAFMILSLLNGGCWLLYDFGITGKLVTLMVETNPDEVMEFLPDLTYRLTLLLLSRRAFAVSMTQWRRLL